MRKTRDALTILHSVAGDGPAMQARIAAAGVDLDVAQQIYSARTHAGLTQRQLAALIGTRQSVIARLEDADYQGHSLRMLQRIAAALNRRLEVRFRANPRRRKGSRAA